MIKIPGPECGYTDLIDYALTQQAKEYKPAFPLRPSAAGDCKRKLAYDLSVYRGFTEAPVSDPNPVLQRVFGLGHSIEWQSIQNFHLLSRFNEDVRIKYKQTAVTLFKLSEIDGKEQELVEGSLDLAVFISNEGGIGDVKSTKDNFSSYFNSKWDQTVDQLFNMKSVVKISPTAVYADNLQAFLEELDDPFFKKNFIQLNLYCCSQFAKERGITHGFIYRYNKNDSRHLEVRFRPDPDLLTKFEKDCNIINQAVAAGKPEQVDRDYTLGSVSCAYCPYKTRCWNAVEEPPPKSGKVLPLTNDLGLDSLFVEYDGLSDSTQRFKKVEEEIVKLALNRGVKKFQTPQGLTYEIQSLKTGGVGNGPRKVLRRVKK